jgi:hypothetical protein
VWVDGSEVNERLWGEEASEFCEGGWDCCAKDRVERVPVGCWLLWGGHRCSELEGGI